MKISIRQYQFFKKVFSAEIVDERYLLFSYGKFLVKQEWLVKLASLNPEPLPRKDAPKLAPFFFFASIAFMIFMAMNFIFYPGDNQIIDLIAVEGLGLIGALASGLYYLAKRRNHLVFYYHFGGVAFSLANQAGEKLDSFLRSLKKAVTQADIVRLKESQAQMRASIDLIHQKGLMNDALRRELLARLEQL